MSKRFVYADNAATTAVFKEVVDEMLPFFTENYGNASSLYSLGRGAKKALDTARSEIAAILNCDAGEIFFTSGGSESDNWAIKGAATALSKKGKHIITSKIEHPAVMNTLKSLQKEGFEITMLDVYENGIVRPEDFEAAIREDTVFATVMFANNEIGTIQPIKELARISKEHGIVFFTDAVQAVGHVDIDLKELGVDMLAFSGHKIHAPRGIGVLYVKKGTKLNNLIDGGGQEKRKRSGTENVAGAVAIAKALKMMTDEEGLKKRAEVLRLRNMLCEKLLTLKKVRLNGDPENRLYGNLNVSCEGVEGEALILWLDLMGVCVSTGSACSTASLDPSHVLLAIGLPHEIAHGSLRITLDFENTEEDVEYIFNAVKEVLQKLRSMSPIWND